MNKESILETIKKSQNKTRRILDEFLKPKLRTAGAKIASINLGHRGKTALAESIDLSKVQQIEPATTSTRSQKLRSSMEVSHKKINNVSTIAPSKKLHLQKKVEPAPMLRQPAKKMLTRSTLSPENSRPGLKSMSELAKINKSILELNKQRNAKPVITAKPIKSNLTKQPVVSVKKIEHPKKVVVSQQVKMPMAAQKVAKITLSNITTPASKKEPQSRNYKTPQSFKSVEKPLEMRAGAHHMTSKPIPSFLSQDMLKEKHEIMERKQLDERKQKEEEYQMLQEQLKQLQQQHERQLIQNKIDQKKREIAIQLEKQQEMALKFKMSTSEMIQFDKQNKRNMRSISKGEPYVDQDQDFFDEQVYVNPQQQQKVEKKATQNKFKQKVDKVILHPDLNQIEDYKGQLSTLMKTIGEIEDFKQSKKLSEIEKYKILEKVD